MQSNHLQSLIALNANRITAKHNSIENAIAQAKQFKLVNVAPAYRVHVEAMVATAFKIADKGRSELKKAVELQKALQAELRANRVAERAAVVKPTQLAGAVYTIDIDGQPTVDSVYEVFYKSHQCEREFRLYSNGKWTYEDGRYTAFGNSSTDGERYTPK